MIVPMKKVLVIVQSKDAEKTVDTLGSVGVMHVAHQQTPQGRDIQQIREDCALIESCLVTLQEAKKYDYDRKPSSARQHYIYEKEWHVAARHLVDIKNRLGQLQEYSSSLGALIPHWEPWGDFDPAVIKKLSEAGIFVRLYEVPEKELRLLPQEGVIKQIAYSKGIVLCAVISQQPLNVPFAGIEPPKMSLSAMKARLSEDAEVRRKLETEIADFIPDYDTLHAIFEELKKELEFKEAVHGMGQTGELSFITGFVPESQTEQIQITGKNQQWGVLITDPAQDDTVPTLISVPAWISLIKPVLRMLGILPGYKEIDVSPLFFISLSVFFGILIGDAGYGLMYFLLTFILQKKMGGRLSDHTVFYLGYVLSSCAIAWGAFTATFFGQQWLVSLGVKPLIPILNDVKFMQTLCFFIGVSHLTLAHLWKIALNFPALIILADIGWCGILWIAFFLAKSLILGDSFPPAGSAVLIISLILIVFFTNPQKNVLKAAGEGLGAVALGVMNNFADVVSYIRLFAVGLAGVAIAETTNAMAASLGHSLVGTIGGIIIILLGHSLNIVLGPMSVLVHGIRLNAYEFAGHIGVTWSGVSYQPLKK